MKMLSIKGIIKLLLPKKVKKYIIRFKYKLLEVQDYPAKYSQLKKHKIALEKVREKARKKNKIIVAFFALHSSVWKYDELYRIMSSDNRFETIVIVCPVVDYGRENMLSEMHKTFNFFKGNRYNVVKSYDDKSETFVDVKKEIGPDIIFYTNPYQGLIDERYYITNFEDTLTCYVRYFFQSISVDQHGRDFIFHNRLWKFFCETEYHTKYALKHYSINKNKYVYTGYPGVDGLIYNNKFENKRKKDNKILKKIIWAPHHTIDPKQELYLSNFLNYYKLMIDIANKYSERAEFTFKPHPLLKVKLYQHDDWGKERTDEYFKIWDSMPNTMLQSDDYKEVFNNSDAMIFDCNSFVVEYLYTGKPSLFTFTNDKIEKIFNGFGKKALNYHYHGYCEKDIIRFIEKVVLEENDIKIKDRDKFYREYLISPNNRTASENIFEELNMSIWLDSSL
ncbi:CDP-glycerol glycerophosphotransferase family protein [Sedimentibacter sp.]|uniref:CDP-glycerol glycerophosphotransferase family protein n=1 Tax=Sedimentibacter sp. TaxID=1960295 RepID=UPI0028AF9BCE|nr:CDP-glycerol glycerophosphotransferase family protein [Sedimentibacter sp.]